MVLDGPNAVAGIPDSIHGYPSPHHPIHDSGSHPPVGMDTSINDSVESKAESTLRQHCNHEPLITVTQDVQSCGSSRVDVETCARAGQYQELSARCVVPTTSGEPTVDPCLEQQEQQGSAVRLHDLAGSSPCSYETQATHSNGAHMAQQHLHARKLHGLEQQQQQGSAAHAEAAVGLDGESPFNEVDAAHVLQQLAAVEPCSWHLPACRTITHASHKPCDAVPRQAQPQQQLAIAKQRKRSNSRDVDMSSKDQSAAQQAKRAASQQAWVQASSHTAPAPAAATTVAAAAPSRAPAARYEPPFTYTYPHTCPSACAAQQQYGPAASYQYAAQGSSYPYSCGMYPAPAYQLHSFAGAGAGGQMGAVGGSYPGTYGTHAWYSMHAQDAYRRYNGQTSSYGAQWRAHAAPFTYVHVPHARQPPEGFAGYPAVQQPC